MTVETVPGEWFPVITRPAYRPRVNSRKGNFRQLPKNVLYLGSAADGRAQVAQRQLRSGLAATLCAVLDVSPAPQQAGPLGV